MPYSRVTASALLAFAPLSCVWADDAPAPPPPQHEWIGKGQFGFLDSKGNSDGESINGALDLSRYDKAWKNALHVEGQYGKSSNVISTERWEVNEQTNYAFTPRLFTFGGLRFEHDLLDGFQYQASVTTGVGYKFLDTQSDQLTVQVGPGFRKLRQENIDKDAAGNVIFRQPLDAESEVIETLGVDYAHVFTATTILTNKLLLEHGSSNSLTTDQIALTVKMSTKLALSVGYRFSDNSEPPLGLKKVDTLTTVNLVYAF